jgi:hypothetical protein
MLDSYRDLYGMWNNNDCRLKRNTGYLEDLLLERTLEIFWSNT